MSQLLSFQKIPTYLFLQIGLEIGSSMCQQAPTG